MSSSLRLYASRSLIASVSSGNGSFFIKLVGKAEFESAQYIDRKFTVFRDSPTSPLTLLINYKFGIPDVQIVNPFHYSVVAICWSGVHNFIFCLKTWREQVRCRNWCAAKESNLPQSFMRTLLYSVSYPRKKIVKVLTTPTNVFCTFRTPIR